jgi:hypothetical protein
MALEQLYSLTAELLDVSPAEFPLTITHLEVGSLWIKLFGQSKVISMVTSKAVRIKRPPICFIAA